MKKTKTPVSTKRTKTPPKKVEILEEEPVKKPRASRKTPPKKVEILEEELPKTPKASKTTTTPKTAEIPEKEPVKKPKVSKKTPPKKVEIPVEEEKLPKTAKIPEEDSPKTLKKKPKSTAPKIQEEEPIKENNKIGIDNINVLFDSLLKISVKDILSSSENPDMTTPFNSILAIS